MGSTLTKPKHEKHIDTNDSIAASAVSCNGWRISFEDRHILDSLDDLPDGYDLIAVLDGHGGNGAVNFIADNFVKLLKNTPEYCLAKQPSEEQFAPYLFANALKKAILNMDVALIDEMRNNGVDLHDFYDLGDNPYPVESKNTVDDIGETTDETTDDPAEIIMQVDAVTNIQKIYRGRFVRYYINKFIEVNNDESIKSKIPLNRTRRRIKAERECCGAVTGFIHGRTYSIIPYSERTPQIQLTRIIKMINKLKERVDKYGPIIAECNTHVRLTGNQKQIIGDVYSCYLNNLPKPYMGNDGACGVFVIRTPRYFVTANVGDCGVGLIRNNRLKQLTKEHKPTADEETKRINRSGLYIERRRIHIPHNTFNINVSRTIGDHAFKKSYKTPTTQFWFTNAYENVKDVNGEFINFNDDRGNPLSKTRHPFDCGVSCEATLNIYQRPDTRVRSTNRSCSASSAWPNSNMYDTIPFHRCNQTDVDMLLFGGCDGVWNNIKSPELLTVIFNHIDLQNITDPVTIQKAIIEKLLENGCRDNITTLVQLLTPLIPVASRKHISSNNIMSWTSTEVMNYAVYRIGLSKTNILLGPDKYNINGAALLTFTDKKIIKSSIPTGTVGGRSYLHNIVKQLFQGICSASEHDIKNWVKTIADLHNFAEKWPNQFEEHKCNGEMLDTMQREDLDEMLVDSTVDQRDFMWDKIQDVLKTGLFYETRDTQMLYAHATKINMATRRHLINKCIVNRGIRKPLDLSTVGCLVS
jgi:serine/threonine protein phosphatase PrpC